jgi:hypothetical protein
LFLAGWRGVRGVGVVGVRWVRWRSNFELDLFCGVVGMVDWGTFGSFAS